MKTDITKSVMDYLDNEELMLEFDMKKALAGAALGTALTFGAMDAQAGVVPQVIAGEAAGEGQKGMQAVANVIHNRMNKTGKSAEQIVTKPKQFSALADKTMMNRNYKQVKDQADSIAKDLEKLPDITNGATHYVTKTLYNKKKDNPDSWISKMQVTATIGNHVFMKEK